ncbi:hypothetical protein COY93_01460 [Candidatus Uhrbacteria bacterium CG_4_10_14_0_8_um_filter_58_22]|uniref:Uncharacterized protein n=1 Tax=Candidatus Uhrbacteria bacterium CG_4_10_14_0_8_um_filter_58_22 TaxID=1975029 RepID=A0A2M7QBV4_9BACT|nr:MAG: hypothetical protein AUJ19_01775 [Parcubacteria group bacterium CG1_02_58_44]PIY63070.1 MAG: hypothetical protein COY93_01460 [Candidatus Uhrbacteria bacterium CG_4_10_14_0_8_um_filter_58_22]
MWTAKRTLFLVAVMAVSVMSQSCVSHEPIPERSDSARVRVTFDVPESVSVLAEILRTADVEPLEIVTSHGEHQAGMLVEEGVTVEETAALLREAHEEFLLAAVRHIDDSIDYDPAMPEGEVLEMRVLSDELGEVLLDVRGHGVDITGLTLDEGDRVRLAGFIDFVSYPLPTGSVMEPDDEGLVLSEEGDGTGRIVQASLSHEPWAPYCGTSYVNQYVSFQTFYFNNVGSFGSRSTYEHETQVYNRNFANYGGYWASNLPMAYYDTAFLDSIDNFTVGSALASSIRTYQRYYTNMSLRPQSSSSAFVRIKGQLGHRSPIWCYSTWCIFADATTGSMTAHAAPSALSWCY